LPAAEGGAFVGACEWGREAGEAGVCFIFEDVDVECVACGIVGGWD
jgi:hypothetical protein